MTKTFRGYVPIEAPSFELESPDGSSKLEVKCVGMLPGSRFLDFMSHATEDDPAGMAGAIDDLFKAAIKNYDEFREFIDNGDNGFGLDALSEIAGYIGELYSNRPTQPSQPASAG